MTATPVIQVVPTTPPPEPSAPVVYRSRRSLKRKVIDNLTGHAFLLGAVVCFAFFSW